MADYNRSEAYDLSLFGAPAEQIPAHKHEVTPATKPVHKPKSTAQIRKESIASAVHALRIFVVSAVLLTLFGAILLSRVNLVILQKEAAEISEQIKDAQSENTRLVMELNATVSREKVDEYAVSVLGMQKLERYQIHYFENRDGDKVVIAGGESSETAG